MAGFVGAEFEDIALSDTDVFEDLPGRVWEIVRDGASERGREILHGIVEGGVSLSTIEEVLELFTKSGVKRRSMCVRQAELDAVKGGGDVRHLHTSCQGEECIACIERKFGALRGAHRSGIWARQ